MKPQTSSSFWSASGRSLYLIVFLFCQWVWRKLFGPRSTLDSRIPGPKPHWLFGHLHLVTTDHTNTLTSLSKEYGPIVRFDIGAKPAVFITDPDMLRHVFVSNVNNYEIGYRMNIKAVTGDSLSTARGSGWTRNRKMLNPAFNHDNLRTFVHHMAGCAEDTVRRWKACGSKLRIDAKEEMMRYASEVTAKVLLRMDGPSEAEEREWFVNSLVVGSKGREQFLIDNLQVLQYTMLLGFLTDTNFLLGTDIKRLLYTRKFVNRIRARVNTLLDRLESEEVEGDLMAYILAARDPNGQPFSRPEVILQVTTFLFGSVGPFAGTMAWGLYFLAQRPDVMAAMRKEVLDIAGTGPIEYSHYTRFQYMKQVTNEILRISTIVPILDRVAKADDTVCGYHIPAGTLLLTSPYVMHFNSDLWDNPHEFRPERWANGGGPKHPLAYIPFSIGRRNCIGQNWAQIELNVVFATIARDFVLSPDPQCGEVIGLPFENRNPTAVTLIAREWNK